MIKTHRLLFTYSSSKRVSTSLPSATSYVETKDFIMTYTIDLQMLIAQYSPPILASSASCSLIASSKNLLTVTSSDNPFRRRVFTRNSRAKCCGGLGSNGCRTMLLSNGSPGTRAQ